MNNVIWETLDLGDLIQNFKKITCSLPEKNKIVGFIM